MSQLRRAAYSAMANIAEGNERRGQKDRLNFFNMAKSSLVEIDCLLEFAKSLNYIYEKTYLDILEIIDKTAFLLNQFLNSQKSQQSQKFQQS